MVRCADCPTVEVEVVVDAPIERVWSLVSDIETPVRFSTELQGATWVEDGARFVGRSWHKATGEWETLCFVTSYEVNRCFGWAVMDADNPSASWRFELFPEPGGGVRLRQWFRMGPAPSGLNVAIEAMPDKEERIVARRLDEHRANMQLTLEGIKHLAESS